MVTVWTQTLTENCVRARANEMKRVRKTFTCYIIFSSKTFGFTNSAPNLIRLPNDYDKITSVKQFIKRNDLRYGLIVLFYHGIIFHKSHRVNDYKCVYFILCASLSFFGFIYCLLVIINVPQKIIMLNF